ncbi:hypothetical protein BC936DRAFT_140435 [Jimgerdemannia flammicorona]|uniref:Uncharacterized protein n=1 Tax=Jimgerdemannia flammicorona TaxID=994334 RepID=A0A433ATW6_9FUNG|nr:hypothetical protein BC936DRAFT_140435 [Jimgerdemannia flammicorona]
MFVIFTCVMRIYALSHPKSELVTFPFSPILAEIAAHLLAIVWRSAGLSLPSRHAHYQRALDEPDGSVSKTCHTFIVWGFASMKPNLLLLPSISGKHAQSSAFAFRVAIPVTGVNRRK